MPNASQERRFDASDAAVSPIVGTLLVVAMTMVLTAAVWLVVSSLGNKAESAPMVAFRQDQVAGEVLVVRVEPGVDWVDELALSGTCRPGLELNGSPFPTTTGTHLIQPGDVLSGCQDGETLQIVATKPNQVLFQATF